jgi:hypothetical protein
MWGRASDLARRRPGVAIIAIIAGALVLALILSGRETALQAAFMLVLVLVWAFLAVSIPLAFLKLNWKMKLIACIAFGLLLVGPFVIADLTRCGISLLSDYPSQNEGYCRALEVFAFIPVSFFLTWFFVFLLYAAVRGNLPWP